MKKRLTVILSVLLLVLLFSGYVAGLQEKGAEGSGEPEQQKNTISVEYSYQNTNMKLELPEDWDYDIIAAAGDGEPGAVDESAYRHGIRFWPRNDPSMKLSLCYHINGIGLCGTGVTFEDISFENGLTATKCTEGTNDNFWFFLIYHDVPGDYAVECSTSKTLWSEYEKIIMSILESVEIGKDTLSDNVIIDIELLAYSTFYVNT